MKILFSVLGRDLPEGLQPMDNEFILLKTTAAFLIRQLTDRVRRSQPNLRSEISKSLLNSLYRYTPGEACGPPGYTIYGIVMTLTQLGTEVVKNIVAKELPRIAAILEERLNAYAGNSSQVLILQ